MCAFCYVGASFCSKAVQEIRKAAMANGLSPQDIVIRRQNARAVALRNLQDNRGNFLPCTQERNTIFASPLVDIAANMDLVRETVAIMLIILEHTCWEIRLLSKSVLLPQLAAMIPDRYAHRVIYGVSTGTLHAGLAAAIERGTPPPAKRLASIRVLQDRGLRTFGMICPSLPQDNYNEFSERMAEELRPDRMEHVWGEVINVRGNSMTATVGTLLASGYEREAGQLAEVSGAGTRVRWNQYARSTFEAHRRVFGGKLRFLQYVKTDEELAQWSRDVDSGAVLLGRLAGR
jgi:DNA repair photolyase